MHFLQPDDVDEHEHQQQQQQTEKKTNKVNIEIDDEEDDEEEIPINKNKNKQPTQTTAATTAVVADQSKSSTTTTVLPLTTTKLSSPKSDQYYFRYLSERKPFPFQGGDKELTNLIAKWGLGESMSCMQFQYEMITDADTYANSKSAAVAGQVHAALLPEFIVALLNSDEFIKHFKCGDGHGNGGNKNSVSLSYPAPVSAVKLQVLRAKETTLDMFDRLIAPSRELSGDERKKKIHPRMRDIPNQIIRDNGHVCNMADVFLPCGITVSDQLRGLFMLNEEENPDCYEIFSEEERNEFLWHVMWRLLAGGAVNQYEDEFAPYKDACRDVYKSLISVGRVNKNSNNSSSSQQKQQKDDLDDNDDQKPSATSTPSLEVQSLAAQVKDIKCKNKSVMKTIFFPKDDRTGNHNFLYVVVDPFRKTCIVWYNAFFSPF